MAIDLPIIGQPNWGEPLNAALRELDSRVGVPGDKGDPGEPGKDGTVTPEMIALRDESVAAKNTTVAARDVAVTAKDDAVAAKVAAQAVGATNDSIMAGVAADPASLFAAQLTAKQAKNITDPGDVRDALNATFVPLSGLKVPLDIWPDYQGFSTYSEWISDIDSSLAGRADKTTIGLTSGPGVPIYAYSFGHPLSPHALLVGGVHGDENESAVSNWRWFESFVASGDPVMVALRQRLRVTWVPFLNASQYRGTRPNSSAVPVDINRNWPMNWDIETNSDPGRYKGTSPLSEPENQALKNLIDSTSIAALIDCHTNEDNAPNLQVGGTPFYVHMNHTVTGAALGTARNLYGVTGGAATTIEEWKTEFIPSLTNWFPKHVRWNLGRHNASSAVVEIQSGMFGSTRVHGAIPFVTKAANRIQCGFITTWLLQWLESGQVDGVEVPRKDYALLNPPSDSTVLVSGGGRLVSYGGAFTPIFFSAGTDYLPVNATGPGLYRISYDIEIYNPVEAERDSEVEVKLAFAPMRPKGSTGSITSGGAVVRIAPGARVVISREAVKEVLPSDYNGTMTSYMCQLLIKATGAPARIADGVRAGSVSVTPQLFLYGYPMPTPKRNP